MADEAIKEPTSVESAELAFMIPHVSFLFYDGMYPTTPVADIGDVFATVLGSSKHLVVGDTSDTFTIFMSRGNKHTLVLTFTQTSFGAPPADAPPAHRGQYNRYHLVLIDFTDLKQVNVPFSVPPGLAYSHESGMWGVKADTNPWAAPKEAVYASIRELVEPVIRWLSVVDSQF